MASKEVLSEEEVDALLEGVDAGEVGVTANTAAASGEVVPYDFTGQDRIERGQMKMLDLVNERFAHEFQDGLFEMVQCPLEVSAKPLRTIKFADYIHSLGVPVSLNLVAVRPLPGAALIVVDPELVFTVVDLFFGGDGRSKAEIEEREFTHTENRVIQLLLEYIFKDLKGAWEAVMAVDFEHLEAESNPQYTKIASSREPLVITTFHVEIGEAGGDFHIGFPVSMLEPIRELLDGGLNKHESGDGDQRLHELQHNLQEVVVEAHGTLGETQLSLRELLALKAGDVIPVTVPEMVVLRAENVAMFRGQFGIHNGKNAVKIVTRVTGQDNSHSRK